MFDRPKNKLNHFIMSFTPSAFLTVPNNLNICRDKTNKDGVQIEI